MRRFGHCLITFFCLISCSTESEKTSSTAFDALVGVWERSNDEKGKQTFEIWKKQNDELYIGEGFTLEGLDTVFKEDIKILFQDSVWIFEVSGLNENPVPFQIDHLDHKSFRCVNEKNPFPKKIVYNINENKLQAVISAGIDKILFDFERVL